FLTSLVIDPQEAGTLYAAFYWGQGVFKSSDSGENWIELNHGLSDRNVQSLVMAPGHANTLYAGTTGGAFRMIDDLLAKTASSPKLSVDAQQYCTGDPWKLTISGAMPNSRIRLSGLKNITSWAIPDWRQTDANGNLIEVG